MLVLNRLPKRYFEVELNGKCLSLEPPTLKILKKIDAAETTDQLIEIASIILSANKERIHVTSEQIEDCVDLDGLILLITKYAEWVGDQKNDPN